jgi:hypothetical protein
MINGQRDYLNEEAQKEEEVELDQGNIDLVPSHASCQKYCRLLMHKQEERHT